MFISQNHISRRTMLRGVGASIALPLLDAMSPAALAFAKTEAGTTPKRFAFVGFPHGAIMDRWSPKQTGAEYEMSTILEPLAPYRQHMTIVSGLRNKPGETPEPHAYIESTWLNCVKPWEHGVANADAGVTADQLAARHIGQDTRLPSLELTTSQQGARLAWRTPTQSLPQEGNPRAVFQKLFRPSGDTDKERAAILSRNRQHPRSRQGTGRSAANQPRRPRPRRRLRLSRLGARDRAARADGGEGRHDDCSLEIPGRTGWYAE